MLSRTTLKQYIVLLVIFLSWANFAYANLEITEIMYSPESGSDYEWVEIYNNGSDSIDINKYRFFHGETNSGPITLKNGENTILSPSSYAIIAKSKTDYSWLDFNGMIFSSSVLSLPDSGDNTYIAISDPNKIIIDEILYDTSSGGSKSSKSSLSKISGEWQSGIPTPGRNNQSLNNSSDNENIQETSNTVNINDSNTSSNISNSISSKKESEILKITTKIIAPKIVVAGIPFVYNSLTTTNRGETYAVGKYIWNFGDGMTGETKNAGPFEYNYEYSGDYLMTISYFDNSFSKQPAAINRMTIKVIPAEIFISSVGNDTNPFIELENKSNYEIVISNWVVAAGAHYFPIPDGMTILPGKKIKLSPKITYFTGEDIKSIYLMNKNGVKIASYPTEVNKPTQKLSSVIKPSKNISGTTTQKSKNNYNETDSQIINLNDLAANASKSGVDISNSTYSFIGLLVIIGIGLASFLILKRKEKIKDYMATDIRPEDMTIIE